MNLDHGRAKAVTHRASPLVRQQLIGGIRRKRNDERNRLDWKSLWLTCRPKKPSKPQAMHDA